MSIEPSDGRGCAPRRAHAQREDTQSETHSARARIQEDEAERRSHHAGNKEPIESRRGRAIGHADEAESDPRWHGRLTTGSLRRMFIERLLHRVRMDTSIVCNFAQAGYRHRVDVLCIKHRSARDNLGRVMGR